MHILCKLKIQNMRGRQPKMGQSTKQERIKIPSRLDIYHASLKHSNSNNYMTRNKGQTWCSVIAVLPNMMFNYSILDDKCNRDITMNMPCMKRWHTPNNQFYTNKYLPWMHGWINLDLNYWCEQKKRSIRHQRSVLSTPRIYWIKETAENRNPQF